MSGKGFKFVGKTKQVQKAPEALRDLPSTEGTDIKPSAMTTALRGMFAKAKPVVPVITKPKPIKASVKTNVKPSVKTPIKAPTAQYRNLNSKSSDYGTSSNGQVSTKYKDPREGVNTSVLDGTLYS